MTDATPLEITAADVSDVPLILALINELAVFEKLRHESVATEASIEKALFGARPAAEAVIARFEGEPVGFALFFHNFSTFLGKPGLYLEDLFIRPAYRGQGFGKTLLSYLAALAIERECERFEWAVLDWNKPALRFYESLGAKAKSDWIMHRMTGDALKQLAAKATAGAA